MEATPKGFGRREVYDMFLKELLEEGIITQEEFVEQKQKIWLNGQKRDLREGIKGCDIVYLHHL